MVYPHLTRYTRPSHFMDFGEIKRTEYYVLGGQTRDSSTLERSNHRSILKAIGGESDTVQVIRDSHWACGWVEAIYIHESDGAALTIAETIAGELEDYPVVNEDDWSDLQYEIAAEYWAGMRPKERMEYCQKHQISIFAATRAELPDDERGELVSDLADGC